MPLSHAYVPSGYAGRAINTMTRIRRRRCGLPQFQTGEGDGDGRAGALSCASFIGLDGFFSSCVQCTAMDRNAHVCIRYSSGGWLGTVRFRPSFPPTSHGVRARSVGVRARTVRGVRGVRGRVAVACGAPLSTCPLSSGYADHERRVCVRCCVRAVSHFTTSAVLKR